MEIFHSDKPTKRFVAVLGSGEKIYFGQPKGKTYIDGASDSVRANYRARHYANEAERHRILNLIISPALLSWAILWGKSHSIHKNIRSLMKKLKL